MISDGLLRLDENYQDIDWVAILCGFLPKFSLPQGVFKEVLDKLENYSS